MTCYRPDTELTTLDTPLVLAHARTAGFRAEARRMHQVEDGPPTGAIHALRQGLGRRLIAVGSALVAERRTHTLAR
jgi:hypothetical protein